MESVITGSRDQLKFMISQPFEPADFLVFWQDKGARIRLELVSTQPISYFVKVMYNGVRHNLENAQTTHNFRKRAGESFLN